MPKSPSRLRRPGVILATLGLLGPALAVAEVNSLEQALVQAKASLDLRYRYEFVDQDPRQDANASTLRTRLTLATETYRGLGGVLEFDNLTVVGADDYNDRTGDPAKADYAVIADPTYTEINQAYLSYASPWDTLLRAGRQRILFDNQRFVGGVAWRQNEQTFDAVSLVNESLPDTQLTYAYVYNVNTILGGDLDGGHHHLIHLHNDALTAANLSVYGYLLEDISDTMGLRLTGKIGLGKDLAALYTAEFAQQEDDGVGAAYEANYYLVEAGASLAGVTGKLGYEVQESDGGVRAFTTPLGTNHAFNGWADLFLATPNTGLKDLYLGLSTALAGPELALIYHRFESDTDSIDFGDEIDVSISQTFAKRYNILLKYAHFMSDSNLPDTDKVWLQLAAKF